MENIRNFSIIAHIDHGKSTLADRFLEMTGAVEKRVMTDQFLDQMDLERERGITIKMQPIRLHWRGIILNLIDTPGHVDFTYEVSRSLAAVEGAILLVDATKGIQAQTLANLKLAQEQHLHIIPVINKVDLPSARIEEVEKEIQSLLGVQDILKISAKTGQGVEDLLERVIKEVPAPPDTADKPLQALVFDSRYDSYRGVVAYVRVMKGAVKSGDKISLKSSKTETSVKEVGYFTPKETPSSQLSAGEIGYIATGLKDANAIAIGDTIVFGDDSSTEALKGYKNPMPVIFVSLYPQQSDEFDLLKDALAKLHMQDPSFVFEPEAHDALGRGFRCGFLGVLHSEIIAERIQREFTVDLVLSRPSVDFRGNTEPWVQLDIITPTSFLSQVYQLLETTDGNQRDTKQLGEQIFLLTYEVPLREIIIDFYDRLKSATKGMASMDYHILDWREADLVHLDILIAGVKEEAFSQIVPRHRAEKEGRTLVKKLKELLPPQLFPVSLQAAIDGNIIARETIRATRRDVTASLYGGDVTRKNKLLDKQKKGKKEMQQKGKVVIPPKVFLDVFRS